MAERRSRPAPGGVGGWASGQALLVALLIAASACTEQHDAAPVATTTTSPIATTVADAPATARTAVGVWTKEPGSHPSSTTSAPAAGTPVGPGDDLHGRWPAYRIDGNWISMTPDNPQAGYDDDVRLVTWRLNDAGVWERTATGPPLPAYRMRYAAQVSFEPVLRDHDILILDANGDMMSIDSAGQIDLAGPPSLTASRTTTPSDGLMSLAATDDAYLAVTGADQIGMWRVGWPAWRQFALPSSAPMTTQTQVGQVRQLEGEFYVDMVGHGDFVPWHLTEPA